MFVSMISELHLKMGHVGSKTRSPGQILEKPCVHLWLRFLFNTLLKLLRMFTSVISWMSLNVGQVGSESRSLGEILEKPCVCCRGHIFSPILLKSLVRMFVLMISWTSLKMCYVGWKTRSLGEILEKPSVWMTLRKMLFENTLWKWENAGIQHIFPFSQCFLPLWETSPIAWSTYYLFYAEGSDWWV